VSAFKTFQYSGVGVGSLGILAPALIFRANILISIIIACLVAFVLGILSRSMVKIIQKAVTEAKKKEKRRKVAETSPSFEREEKAEEVIYSISLPILFLLAYIAQEGSDVWSALGSLLKQILGAVVLGIIISGIVGVVACAVVIMVAGIAGRSMGGGAIAYFISEVYSFLTPFLLGVGFATIILFSMNTIVRAIVGPSAPDILAEALDQAREYLSSMFGGV